MANQYRIRAKIEEARSQELLHHAEALEKGYEWEYESICPVQQPCTYPVCDETLSILTLFGVLQTSFKSLGLSDSAELRLVDVTFRGFHYRDPFGYHMIEYAKFLFRARPHPWKIFYPTTPHLIADWPVLESYQAMVAKWQDLGGEERLTREDILAIVETGRAVLRRAMPATSTA